MVSASVPPAGTAGLRAGKLDLPRPVDAPQRFDPMDPGPLPARKASADTDGPPATGTH